MSELHLQETFNGSRVKKAPKKISIPVPFSYTASDDGTDENLLILLHGLGVDAIYALYSTFAELLLFCLGDSHLPFSKLGRQLKLPQTAVLALRAPEQFVTST